MTFIIKDFFQQLMPFLAIDNDHKDDFTVIPHKHLYA